VGAGGEMTQALYAHMNKKKKTLKFKTSQLFLENCTSVPKGIYLGLHQNT
jgi:hypothetical protein